ncbi:phage major capsid protein [Arthrobacter sp. UKPF54-2]|uniref:phage major capsid protein n=1 Tax=Arthrobacter sp. UKPF54-2 TaxID=2600159 RepID=UPI0028F6E880|nr:phage major capsid protein [Arthrobacter sp. UKPF54-2]
MAEIDLLRGGDSWQTDTRCGVAADPVRFDCPRQDGRQHGVNVADARGASGGLALGRPRTWAGCCSGPCRRRARCRLQLRDGGATGKFLLGDPAAGSAPNIWRIPRIVSPAVPAGRAILADWSRAVVAVREEATMAVDTSGPLFDKNQAKMRVESRLGFGVKVPSAFAVLDLSAS